MDFADVRRYPPEQYFGLVVLRLPDIVGTDEITRVLKRFLMETEFVKQLKGRLAIIEQGRVRFRPPLVL